MEPFADNFIPVIPGDTLHPTDKPFCYDQTCMCHEDQENIAVIAQHVLDGLITLEDAINIVNGKTI